MSTLALDVVTYTLIACNVILALITLNWTICFSLLREYPCIKPRLPVVPVIIGTFNTVFLLIDRSQILLYSHPALSLLQFPGWRLVNSAFIQLWIGTLYLSAFRAWHMFFALEFNKSLADVQWRLYINPAENDWFLKHRQLYGNPRLMVVPFVIAWLVLAVPYLLEVYLGDAFSVASRAILVVQLLLAALFLLAIWRKMPVFDDVWRIRNDMILEIRLVVLGMLMYAILGIALNEYFEAPSINYAFLTSVLSIVAFMQSYTILYAPLHRFRLPTFACRAHMLNKKTTLRQRMELSQTQYRVKRALTTDSDNSDKRSQPHLSTQFYKLKTILLHEDGFRLFAAHLMRELAIENLLFFVETSQWLDYVMQLAPHSQVARQAPANAAEIYIRFNEHAPHSRIVSWSAHDDRVVSLPPESDSSANSVPSSANSGGRPSATMTTSATTSSALSKPKSAHASQLTVDLNLDEFELSTAITDPWLQCVKLFRKYVTNGSYFCINISGENRITLYDYVGYDTTSTKVDEELLEVLKEKCNHDLKRLMRIYDAARYSVFRLMIYSVSRFEASDVYKEYFISPQNDQP